MMTHLASKILIYLSETLGRGGEGSKLLLSYSCLFPEHTLQLVDDITVLNNTFFRSVYTVKSIALFDSMMISQVLKSFKLNGCSLFMTGMMRICCINIYFWGLKNTQLRHFYKVYIANKYNVI